MTQAAAAPSTPSPAGPPGQDPTMSIIRRYAELERKARSAKDGLETITDEMAQMAESVLNCFTLLGVQSVNFDDLNLTLYVANQIWPKMEAARPEVIRVMREAGLDDMISENFNTNSLAAWIREQTEGEDGLPILPEFFKGVLSVVKKTDIRARAK